MPPLPNPRETIVRNALLFPADGTEPRIISKSFSEVASKANPGSMYTRTVDLRSHYGKHMDTIHCQCMDSTPNPETLKCNEGEFFMYSNVSPELPINQLVARIIGIDPLAYESKVFWRGDIIVVKVEDWPGPLVIGGGNHKLYHDVDLSFKSTVERVLKNMYERNELKDWIAFMLKLKLDSVYNDRLSRLMFQTASPHLSLSTLKPLDIDKGVKEIRFWKKLSRSYEDMDVEAILNKVCALCAGPGKPDLKACSGCRHICYCSKECQKSDWKYHKLECKSKKTI